MNILRFLPLLALLFSICAPAQAADGAFTRDGQRIYFATGRLKMLDLARPGRFDVITSSPLFGGEKIDAVARATDGAILCLSEHHLAALDPQSHTFRALYDSAAEGVTLHDLAVNAKDGTLLVAGSAKTPHLDGSFLKLFLFMPGFDKPASVFSRRVDALCAPVFDPQGQLFFADHGDLWQGRIQLEKTDENAKGPFTPANSRGVLEAERIAPLARLETYSGTVSGTGVLLLAVAPPLLYIQTQRMGGTGWGTVCTIPLPKAQAEYPDGNLHPDARYGDVIKVLSSVKIVDSISAATFLCASPAGDKVFYREGTNYFLIEKHGKPRQLPVKGSLLD